MFLFRNKGNCPSVVIIIYLVPVLFNLLPVVSKKKKKQKKKNKKKTKQKKKTKKKNKKNKNKQKLND